MYPLSSQLSVVIDLCKQLVKLHLFRYKPLVDNSEKREECTYAKLTQKYFLIEAEQELNLLISLRDHLNQLIGDVSEFLNNKEVAE